MSALIDQVAEYLFDEEIGVIGTDMFVGYLPDSPTTCMAIIDTGGTAPETDIPLYNPTFQIFIRSADFATGQALLDSVKSALHRFQNSTLDTNGTYVYYILALSNGGHTGRDEAGRDLFSINFRAKTR